jgi:hypothetical protein
MAVLRNTVIALRREAGLIPWIETAMIDLLLHVS